MTLGFLFFAKAVLRSASENIPDLNTRIDNDIQTNINNSINTSINNSTQTATNTNIPNDINNSITKSFNNTNLNTRIYDYTETSSIKRWVAASSYPVVIITWVHYLGPPVPSTSQILGTFSRFSETFLAEREGGSLP